MLKLREEETWSDLEALVGDKKKLKKFLRKLGKKARELTEIAGAEEDSSLVPGVLAVALKILKEAEGAAEDGVVQAEMYERKVSMAKDYLGALPPKMSEMRQPVLGMVEKYVIDIHAILCDIEEDLKRLRKPSGGGGGEGKAKVDSGGILQTVQRSIMRFRFGYGGGGGGGGAAKATEQKLKAWDAKLETLINQINRLVVLG